MPNLRHISATVKEFESTSMMILAFSSFVRYVPLPTDVSGRYLGKRVYIINTNSEMGRDQEESAVQSMHMLSEVNRIQYNLKYGNLDPYQISHRQHKGEPKNDLWEFIFTIVS